MSDGAAFGDTMSRIGSTVLNQAVQDANIWLNALSQRLMIANRNHSYRILRAVLHALRDMLAVNEAARLAGKMPTLIRGVYFEGWNPSEVPCDERTLRDLIGRVQRDFRFDPLDRPEKAISAVFWVLNTRIGAGEIEDIRDLLEPDIREIWVV